MSAFTDLPGTDPRFHEARKYLSPVVYKGTEILASHGSCKQTGCNYSSAWTSNTARDEGMWKHRAEHVRRARIRHFLKITHRDKVRTARLLRQSSDHNLVTYDKWHEILADLVRGALGVEMEYSENKLRMAYHIGQMTSDVAKKIIAEYQRV